MLDCFLIVLVCSEGFEGRLDGGSSSCWFCEALGAGWMMDDGGVQAEKMKGEKRKDP